MALLIATIVVTTWLARRGLLGPPERAVGRQGPLRFIAAWLSLGAATIHVAVIEQHVAEYWLFGLLFALVAAFQAGWALLYLSRPTAAASLLGIVINGAVVAVWLWSRTVGLPVGPHAGEPEPVGLAGLTASAFEAGLVAIVASTFRAKGPGRARRRMPVKNAVIGAAFSLQVILVLTGLALLQASGGGH